MTRSTRRGHVLSFRISEAEYRLLRNTCEGTGVRSVSDFARMAVQRIAGQGMPRNADLEECMEELERIVERLRVQVEQSSKRSLKAGGAGG